MDGLIGAPPRLFVARTHDDDDDGDDDGDDDDDDDDCEATPHRNLICNVIQNFVLRIEGYIIPDA